MFEKYLERADFAPEELTFKILVNEESISKMKTAEYICKGFEDAGMSASAEEVDFDTYVQRINDGEYTLFVGETTVALNQDFSFLAQSGKNAAGYSNSEMDNLLETFRAETKTEGKKKVAEAIAKKFVDDLPVISLYYMKNTLLSDSDIEGKLEPMQTNIVGNIANLKIKK